MSVKPPPGQSPFTAAPSRLNSSSSRSAGETAAASVRPGIPEPGRAQRGPNRYAPGSPASGPAGRTGPRPRARTRPRGAANRPGCRRPLSMIDIGQLTAHPGNVGAGPDLVTEFVASVAEIGARMLLPVARDDTGRFRVIEGHHRRLGELDQLTSRCGPPASARSARGPLSAGAGRPWRTVGGPGGLGRTGGGGTCDGAGPGTAEP
jgi:hypothetical protein